MNFLFFVFLSSLLSVNCVVVKLNDGPIDGTTARSKSGRLYHKFLAVPYAKPPVGELRFQPPVPPAPWNETRDASILPPRCIQALPNKIDGSIIGQEDCLYLNVYVPDELFNASQKNPVIVGIHGGAFISGSGNDYQPDYFMERDVVMVTINYRLGTFGFLGFNDKNISGNFGLKDQSLALKWVNANIHLFGGDPQNVTLLGGSAGAASVHYHMFSPLSKGLFQKAIMESGGAYAQWASLPPFLQFIVKTLFLGETNCKSASTSDTLTCLQSKPAEDFVTKYGLSKKILFLPIVEDNVEVEPFLPEKPNLTNYVTRVPHITGINSGEGALIMTMLLQNGEAICTKLLKNSTTCIKAINAEKEKYLPILNLYMLTAKDIPKVTEAVNNYYFGSEDIGLDTASHAVDMITDSAFLYPLMKNIESNLNEPSIQQYLYLYDHRGSFSGQDGANLTVYLGVSHGDEGPLLNRDPKLEAKWTIQDRLVSEALLKFWINFAISGDPNRHSVEKIWNPVKKGYDIEYLHITGEKLAMEKNLYADRYKLWCSLPTGWLPCPKY